MGEKTLLRGLGVANSVGREESHRVFVAVGYDWGRRASSVLAPAGGGGHRATEKMSNRMSPTMMSSQWLSEPLLPSVSQLHAHGMVDVPKKIMLIVTLLKVLNKLTSLHCHK